MTPVAATAAAVSVADQADLVQRAAGGDSAAFEHLVANRVDQAFRTARAILGNESDARDAMQTAFVSAWRELPRLRDVERFDAWLGRILVNACRAQIRRRGRVREVSLDDSHDRPSIGPTISDQVGETDM